MATPVNVWMLLLLPFGTIYVILHQILTSVWSFKFGVSDLNSVWRFDFGVKIWIWCKWFEFGASVFEFGVSVFEFSVNNLNLVWVIRIRCEWFEFGVSDLNLVCTCGPPYQCGEDKGQRWVMSDRPRRKIPSTKDRNMGTLFVRKPPIRKHLYVKYKRSNKIKGSTSFSGLFPWRNDV